MRSSARWHPLVCALFGAALVACAHPASWPFVFLSGVGLPFIYCLGYYAGLVETSKGRH